MVAGDVDQQKLLNKQAEWAITMNEQRRAAELYLAANDYQKAIDLAGKNKWADLFVVMFLLVTEFDPFSL